MLQKFEVVWACRLHLKPNEELTVVSTVVLSKKTVTAVYAILRKQQKRICEYAIKLPLLFMFDIYIIIKLSKLNFV